MRREGDAIEGHANVLRVKGDPGIYPSTLT
jgi:hypothetical protein